MNDPAMQASIAHIDTNLDLIRLELHRLLERLSLMEDSIEAVSKRVTKLEQETTNGTI